MPNPGATPQFSYGGFELYEEPDPETVDTVWRRCGKDAVIERWFYLSPSRLLELRRQVTGDHRKEWRAKRQAA